MIEIDAALQGLLTAMAPGERRKLARDIAADLRSRQQRRVAAQLNPDGSAYEPRKPRLRAKVGRIRRTMFAKLRAAKYLKASSTAEAAVVFRGLRGLLVEPVVVLVLAGRHGYRGQSVAGDG